MNATVNALHFRKKFGEIIDQASIHGNTVVVERMQKPLVVVMPYDDYIDMYQRVTVQEQREDGAMLLRDLWVKYDAEDKKSKTKDSTKIVRSMRDAYAKKLKQKGK